MDSGAECGARAGDARVKIRDVLTMLQEDGWRIVRQRGSHRQLKHMAKPGLVTVAGQPGDELAPGTLNSILKQAGLKP
jgi:predicted RNA binding protein YcfA (HicA-like mRNA interferase family)